MDILDDDFLLVTSPAQLVLKVFPTRPGGIELFLKLGRTFPGVAGMAG